MHAFINFLGDKFGMSYDDDDDDPAMRMARRYGQGITLGDIVLGGAKIAGGILEAKRESDERYDEWKRNLDDKMASIRASSERSFAPPPPTYRPRYVAPAPARFVRDEDVELRIRRELAAEKVERDRLRRELEAERTSMREEQRMREERDAKERETLRQQRAQKMFELERELGDVNRKINGFERQVSGVDELRKAFYEVTYVFAQAHTATADELLREMRKDRRNVVLNFPDSVISRAPVILNLGDGAGVENFTLNVKDSVLYQCSFFDRLKGFISGFGREPKTFPKEYFTKQAPVYFATAEQFAKNLSEVPKGKPIVVSVKEDCRTAPVTTLNVPPYTKIPLPAYAQAPQMTTIAGGRAMEYNAWQNTRDRLSKLGGAVAELETLRGYSGRLRRQMSSL